MALRTIKSVRFGSCSVSIRRDAEWGEYRVVSKAPGSSFTGTYHTDDKVDARATAADIIRRMRRAGVCR